MLMNQPIIKEETALLILIADIRAAVGDPTGKLMQDELVEHCRRLREDKERLDALDESFATHTSAHLARVGPYMNNKNVAFSTNEFRPRLRENFRNVREVADKLISLREDEATHD